jgi:CO/xanthine dehydrogenase FAD-binding subunit
MKAVDFEYHRPTDIEEACRLLAEADGEARIIAGGQTLVPLLAMRLARPTRLIDINRIKELQGIELGAAHVTVRACTRQAAALADESIGRRLPLLAKALGFVGHVQTRNRGTIGGSLAAADPSAEIGLAALAIDCEVQAQSVSGERAIPIAQFFHGPMSTELTPEDCLTAIRFSIWQEAGSLGTGFQEISIRRSDFALVAVAVQLVIDAKGVCQRIAMSVGAGATPVRVDAASRRLTGTRLEPRDLTEAARLASEAIVPVSDLHASAEYRRRVAGALVVRATIEAREEASARNG